MVCTHYEGEIRSWFVLFPLFAGISGEMQKFCEGEKNYLKIPSIERAGLQAQTAELQNRRTDGQTLSSARLQQAQPVASQAWWRTEWRRVAATWI